jgi:alkanesulfonate monooxygenase SsuD/methylene tetrahydromethanopterin reductase-like flavin-dependent oxidoreductase (luciferase family)
VESDPEALANVVNWTMGGAKIPEEKSMSVGSEYSLVGSPAQASDQIAALSDAGTDGLCLTFMNCDRRVSQFFGEVLPLLEDT